MICGDLNSYNLCTAETYTPACLGSEPIIPRFQNHRSKHIFLHKLKRRVFESQCVSKISIFKVIFCFPNTILNMSKLFILKLLSTSNLLVSNILRLTLQILIMYNIEEKISKNANWVFSK